MASTWETLEERERRVKGTRTTSTMARAAEQIPEAKTLAAAFAERPFISREDLKAIARQPYERPVITFYLNLAPQQGVRSDPPIFVSVFHSLRHRELEARKPYIESLPRADRLAIPDDLAEVQAFLEGYQAASARALVIFKSGEQLNRVMPLPARVADSLTIDADPYIEPLDAIMEEQRRLLVVDLSKEKTTLSLYELGFEEPVHAITSYVPRSEVELSREYEVQRHRLTHLQWHFKASAQAAERFFRERGCDRLALIGEQTLLKEFEDYLAKPLRFEALETALGRWLPASVSGGPAEVLPPIIDWAALAELGRQLDRSGTGDGGALAGMIAEFRVEADSRIQALRQAAEASDGDGLRKAAHGLRGPAGSLGALQVAALAAELERHARERSPVGAEDLIDSLQAAVERASMALEQRRGDLFFEGADLAADRGRGDAKLLRRCREAAGLDDANVRRHLFQDIHPRALDS